MRKAFYILGSLEDADIEWIARTAVRRSLLRGDVLINEGEPIDSLFILVEGQLSVRIGAAGERELATLLPGEIVGEISFVDQRKPTASVLASREARVLALSRTAISGKLARDIGFAARFYRAIAVFLADRLATTTARLGYGSPDQDSDVDEIDDTLMNEVSLATIRFDKLLRYLADEQNLGSFVKPQL